MTNNRLKKYNIETVPWSIEQQNMFIRYLCLQLNSKQITTKNLVRIFSIQAKAIREKCGTDPDDFMMILIDDDKKNTILKDTYELMESELMMLHPNVGDSWKLIKSLNFPSHNMN